ncbi:papain family cysteine protease (macronuclear) [Tetrahymena thermophila SB210]|uniref:Papain family cysteine protease n=1 Tax=Tetrahymena thermophila (strain SB210) TaxID=312017 RepID=I7M1D8_TETTS|nr:papain family cysteine protease [Tetrahymena thermophila SB210]EAR96137.1 papain family cysteine protease [Tetrahymena thermophila SB210]|eukprot:XP_001016382.1 papain family cysteine protease [Tetrahymena thermophila SB210]
MSSRLTFTAFIALLICSSLAQSTNNNSLEALTNYNQWRISNPRVFLNEAQKQYRQTVFLENFQKIKEHNANTANTYQQGLNQFSDMTQEEFVNKILMSNSQANSSQPLSSSSSSSTQQSSSSNTSLTTSSSTVAASVDWRTKGAVSPVKNQGDCGACWAFSATGSMESFHYIKSHVLSSFSEQQLVDCVVQANGYYSHGCNGGSFYQALLYASKIGMESESSYPYTGVWGTCKVSSTNNGYKPISFVQIGQNTQALQAALNLAPVSVSIDATSLYQYTSGVYNNCNPQQLNLNHAVLAVGYDSQGNWIIKNSWGASWGQQGFFLLAPNNTCGILENTLQITA